MSQWTHVNASIRYDGIPDILGEPITEKELGTICTVEDWKETEIPCGSEGSIQYTLIKTGNDNSLACRAVIFIGDLRDYDNVQEILDYFTRITKGKMIRSGILEIDVGFKNPQMYRYDTEKLEWVK